MNCQMKYRITSRKQRKFSCKIQERISFNYKNRKRLRAQYEDTENVYNDIKEAITDKIKENRIRRIIKVAQQNRIKRRQWKKNL